MSYATSSALIDMDICVAPTWSCVKFGVATAVLFHPSCVTCLQIFQVMLHLTCFHFCPDRCKYCIFLGQYGTTKLQPGPCWEVDREKNLVTIPASVCFNTRSMCYACHTYCVYVSDIIIQPCAVNGCAQ